MDVNALFNSVMGNAGAGIDKAVGAAKSSSMPSGLVGGAAAGGLAALLLSSKKSRKLGKKALKYGGAAALGGLAYKAWRDHKTSQASGAPAQPGPTPSQAIPAPPQGSIFDLANQQSPKVEDDVRLSLVRAMISAAKSDGHIDATERERIEGKIHALQIGQEEQKFLIDQLNAPSDPIVIARLSKGDEHAAELYLASALSVDVDTPEEHRYLERLADALRLPNDLRTRLDEEARRSVDLVA